MNVFFTADEHYGHGNVIAYCQRPFANLEEMDEALIERHNALVKKKDLVYHLGDFAFRYHEPYLNRLHGRHVLILGNHDASRKKHLGTAWEAVEPVLLLKIGGRQLWLSHYAHRVWPNSHHGPGICTATATATSNLSASPSTWEWIATVSSHGAWRKSKKSWRAGRSPWSITTRAG